MASPVAASRLCGTLASTRPVIPCSGEKSAFSFTCGAAASRSTPRRPWESMPVWLVMRPTVRPASGAKSSATRRSSPVSVEPSGRSAAPSAAGLAASARLAAAATVGSSRGAKRVPTAALTRRRSSATSPLP